jgi:hypothetical protein
MLVGITTLAAAVKVSIRTIEAQLAFGPALLLGGRIWLILIGDAQFRARSTFLKEASALRQRQ